MSLKLKKRIALANLGGVRKPSDIPVFLFNMFNDMNIIPIKQPIRAFAAFIIMVLRSKDTYAIFKRINSSPIFQITKKQAERLSRFCKTDMDFMFSYSKPFLKDEVDTIIPMYNFYSHTTHGIILKKLKKTFPPFCIFGEFFDLVETRIKDALADVAKEYKPAILLSAHSLPEKLMKKTNDPYKKDIEVFYRYLKKRFGDSVYLSFQSKLGPIKWIEPSTIKAIEDISRTHDALIVVPISFVSDNTETVYEIDVVYKKLAERCGMQYFKRTECFNFSDDFMQFLSSLIKERVL